MDPKTIYVNQALAQQCRLEAALANMDTETFVRDTLKEKVATLAQTRHERYQAEQSAKAAGND